MRHTPFRFGLLSGILIGVAGASGYWLGYNTGREDGYAVGFAEGHNDSVVQELRRDSPFPQGSSLPERPGESRSGLTTL